MAKSPPWNIFAAGYVHNATHKHRKLGPRATKMVFIRYPEHSKGFVLYGEHPNGGMTEVDSRNVEFLQDEFPSNGEINQDTTLYELPPNDRPSLSEGEDFNTHRVTEDSTLPLFRRDDKLLVSQENQPENDIRPPSLVHEHDVSPLVQYNDNDSLSTEDSIPLRDRGRNTSEGEPLTGPVLRTSECGRMPRRYFQIEEEIFPCTPLEIEEPTSF